MRRTANGFIDILGQLVEPGNIVAISTINDRSPQTIIAQVEEIYLDDSKGNPYKKGHSEYSSEAGRWVWVEEDGCAVLARPLIAARNFYRSGNKSVTYVIPENIVKVGDSIDKFNFDSEKSYFRLIVD